MFTDARGHSITTSSRSAAEACDRAISSYCARRSETTSILLSSIKDDEECALTQALMGLFICSLRKDAAVPLATDAYKKATEYRNTATEREQRYVDALGYALERQPDRLVACYENIIQDYPNDLLALALAQGEAFWTGDMIRSEELSSSTRHQWDPTIEGYDDWLAIRAFDLEETGDLVQAENIAREAIEIDQGNIWATHALAHVLEMRGDSDSGIRLLDDLKEHWTESNQLKFHLWWHRCLCHVERREYDVVLDTYDEWIRNASQPLMMALPDFYLDTQNAASLLMRLELTGMSVGQRWQELASAVESAYLDISSPFTSIHYAMTFAATGEFHKLDQMLSEIQSFSCNEGSLAAAYRHAIPVIKGIKAHRQRQFNQTLQFLMPCRHAIWQLGGSHAQRDILFQMMFDAARQLQRTDDMKRLHQDLERIGFSDPQHRIAYQL